MGCSKKLDSFIIWGQIIRTWPSFMSTSCYVVAKTIEQLVVLEPKSKCMVIVSAFLPFDFSNFIIWTTGLYFLNLNVHHEHEAKWWTSNK